MQLPLERAQETETMLGMMLNLDYVRREEVPAIPRLPKEPAAIIFAPLGDAPVVPSVVLFACRTASAMLLNEAANRAGAGSTLPLLGRPICRVLPAAMLYGTVSSLGCIGNRVYTGLAEDELYVAVPGAKLESVSEALGIVATANTTLGEFARGRQAFLSSVLQFSKGWFGCQSEGSGSADDGGFLRRLGAGKKRDSSGRKSGPRNDRLLDVWQFATGCPDPGRIGQRP
jgi:hypothetical protein